MHNIIIIFIFILYHNIMIYHDVFGTGMPQTSVSEQPACFEQAFLEVWTLGGALITAAKLKVVKVGKPEVDHTTFSS